MSLSLVKKGLKQLDHKYSILQNSGPSITQETSIEVKKKKKKSDLLPPTKDGLKKLKQELRYRHSKSFIEKKRLSNSKTLSLVPKPIDLIRKEKEDKDSTLETNVSNLLNSRIGYNKKIAVLRSQVLNYEELNAPKPIRRLKKRARELKAAARYI